MADEDLIVRVGLTEKQYLATLTRMEQRTVSANKKMNNEFAKGNRNFVRGTERANRSANSFASGGLRNVSMQLSQVAQQGAVTGNYFQALTIQAADIGLAFGTLGIAIGAAISVLGPLAQNMLFSGESAESAGEQLDAFSTSLKVAQDLAAVAATPIDELREKFGEFADEVQRGAQIAAQAALSQAMISFADAATGIGAALDDVSAAAVRYQQTLTALDTVTQTLGARTVSNASAFDDAERSVSEAQQAMREAAEAIGLTSLQAIQLDQALSDLARAEGMEGVAEAASDALDLIDAMFDSTQNIPPEVSAIVLQLENVLSAAAAGTQAFDDMAAAAGGAANEAARLAANTLAAAMARNYEGREGQVDPNILPPPVVPTRPTARPPRRTGGGGRRGGISEAARQQAEMAREAQRYIDQTRTALERYNQELAKLETLNEAGFFKDAPEAYARAVAQVQQEFERIQFEKLQQGIDSISDAMADAIVNGENMGEALRGVFRQIANDLISSGIRGLLMQTFGLGGQQRGGGGGLLGGLFAGFFDKGGIIPAGQFGIAGENGPEIIRGPAAVTSTADTARMMNAQKVELAINIGVENGNIVPLIRQVSGNVALQVSAQAASAQSAALPGQIAELQQSGEI